MSCGARHSFIWTNNGYCYSFGNNFNAQLGYNFSKADFKENQVMYVEALNFIVKTSNALAIFTPCK
jgi:alpha-tubulin suppressor-like RCC1 family protein